MFCDCFSFIFLLFFFLMLYLLCSLLKNHFKAPQFKNNQSKQYGKLYEITKFNEKQIIKIKLNNDCNWQDLSNGHDIIVYSEWIDFTDISESESTPQ